MKILYIFAHPEPRSLNAALRDEALAELKDAGHEICVSDLYAMHWKATLDREDFPKTHKNKRLNITAASGRAFAENAQSADVTAEQEKLKWADVLILHFPLWWYSMPAILKGWIDRVYAYGLAYGVGEHSDRHWGDRFGEGCFAGKRAMLIVTAGGWQEHYAARGINGPIEDLLFPIQHGILYYPGFDVLPPFVAYRVDRLDQQGFTDISTRLRQRMRTMETTPPIPYRQQNGGQYDIPNLQLRNGYGGDKTGFAMHLSTSDDLAE